MSLNSKFRKLRERLSKNIKRNRHAKQTSRDLAITRQIFLNMFTEQLKEKERYNQPKSLIKHSYKIFSQNEEDGIIREIFNRIGTTNKTFVEFGCGDGLENNTLALLLEDWKGLWLEGSSRSVNNIKDHFSSVIDNGQLNVVEAFVTRENINNLINAGLDTKDEEIDLLVVDIDGNDAHIFSEINVINPRVVVIEYNARFHPPVLFSVDYNPNHAWQGDAYMGASLSFLEEVCGKKGYKLVGCDLSGTNAFFVREDLTQDLFLEPFTADKHYEPSRYFLVGQTSGTVANYTAVSKILSATESINKSRK